MELLLQPWLALLGAAMVIGGAVVAMGHFDEAITFLAHGWQAWLSAAPLLLVLVPFHLVYGFMCLRAVAVCWLDALGKDEGVAEGVVTHTAATPFSFSAGRTVLSGTATQLTLHTETGDVTFQGVELHVLERLKVGDRARIRYTPRVRRIFGVALLLPPSTPRERRGRPSAAI